MDPEEAVTFWRQLDRVAAREGRRIRIHLTGGEPFGQWENLVAILRAALRADLPPPQKVETNAYWALDDEQTRDRLTVLRDLGVVRLDVSTDVFHAEFVPIECVRRCVRIAGEVFGHAGVRVRWEDFGLDDHPTRIQDMNATDREGAFRDALRRRPERMTGRAAMEVAHLLPPRPVEDFVGQTCVAELLKSKHVHVGPEGDVFPGVCSGILLGNARTEPMDRMWCRLEEHWQDQPILARLIEEGPVALYRLALQHGYEPIARGYAHKCHLCTHVRRYLFQTGVWTGHLGPAALYPPDPPTFLNTPITTP